MATGRFLAASLLLVSLTATAQRGGGGHASGGGSRGFASSGFSARSAPAFQGGFSSAPRSGFAPQSGYHYARPGYAAPNYRMSAGRFSTARPASNVRPAFYQNGRGRRPYNRGAGGVGFYGYPYSLGYGYPGYGYLDDGFGDDTTDIGPLNSGYTDSGYADNGSAPPPPDDPNAYNYGPIAENNSPPPQVRRVVSAPPPAPEQTTTIIFKDGRPAQQIENYIATHTTITVFHGARHIDIPVDEIDIAATEKANRQAGVDFKLP
jgi:hypothetical protein